MRSLGLASPEELLALRPSVLGYWAALHYIDPDTPSRSELGHAIVASTLANVNRDTRRKASPYKPAEFMPYYQPPEPREMSAAEVRRKNKALSEAVLRRLGLDPDEVRKGKKNRAPKPR